MKIALKTYLFYLSSIFLTLQTTKGPPLIPVRGGKEEWQQKRIFHVSSGCFLGKKRPKKNCKKLQSKPTCGPPRGSELFSNQPEHFPGARGRHTCKRKRKEQFDSELLMLWGENIRTPR